MLIKVTITEKIAKQYDLLIEDGFAMTDEFIFELETKIDLSDEELQWFITNTPSKRLTQTKNGKIPLWIHLQQTPPKSAIQKMKNLLAEKDIHEDCIHVTKGHRDSRLIEPLDIVEHYKSAQSNKQINFRFETYVGNTVAVWGRPYSNGNKLQLITIYSVNELKESGIPLKDAFKEAGFNLVQSDHITVNKVARK